MAEVRRELDEQRGRCSVLEEELRVAKEGLLATVQPGAEGQVQTGASELADARRESEAAQQDLAAARTEHEAAQEASEAAMAEVRRELDEQRGRCSVLEEELRESEAAHIAAQASEAQRDGKLWLRGFEPTPSALRMSELEAEREKLVAKMREQELVATRLQARVAELEAELAAAVELAAQAAGTQRAAADVHSLSAEQEELAKQNDSMTSCSDVHLVLDGQYDAFVSDERAKTAAIIADIATKLKLDPSRIAVGDHQAGSIILQVACLLHSLAFFGR